MFKRGDKIYWNIRFQILNEPYSPNAIKKIGIIIEKNFLLFDSRKKESALLKAIKNSTKVQNTPVDIIKVIMKKYC